MKVGIIGGAFDPVHYGHLNLGKDVLSKLELEEVWFMPCYNHVFNKKIENFHHRYKMIELALNEVGEERMKVSDYEGNRKGASYTVDTVRGLLRENPKLQIYWVMGADVIETLDKWKEPYELVKLAKFVIFSRNGKKPSKTPENSIFLENSNTSNVSSTEIKRLLKEGKPIEGLTTSSVIKYIKENDLYSGMK